MFRKERYMVKAALISLWFNVTLFILKLSALILVRSLAIAADLAITLVGLTVSVILYHSIKLSNKPADLVHNYGYGKVEHVCEAVEGIALVGISAVLILLAFKSFVHPAHVSFPWIGFASSSIGLSLNFTGSFFLFVLAKKSHSPAVKAEAVHYKLEGFISFSIAAAFLLTIAISGSGFGFLGKYIDPAVTVLVCGLILVPSVKLSRQAFFNLLDASISEHNKIDIIAQLGAHAESYCNFKDIKTRQSGLKKFVEMTVVLPRDLSFESAHAVALKMERAIRRNIKGSEVSVKIEPCGKDCALVADGQPCPYMT
jgi:cation diffusion facilitator family transporter